MSTSEEFLLKQNSYSKTVEIDEARSVEIKVSRTRTSEGHCSIFLKIGEEKRIEIANSANTYAGAYTEVAIAIANLLKEAIDNPCALPKT